MDHVNSQEKEQSIRELEQRQEHMVRTGKTIIFTIATLNILMAVVSFFARLNILSLAIQIALSIALYRGVSWVRFLFAVGAALGSILTLYVLFELNVSSETPVPIMLFFILYLIYEVASTVILFASKSVTEFLYIQKNG